MFVAVRSALEQQMTARIQTEVELLTEDYRSGCQFQKGSPAFAVQRLAVPRVDEHIGDTLLPC